VFEEIPQGFGVGSAFEGKNAVGEGVGRVPREHGTGLLEEDTAVVVDLIDEMHGAS
jgi:hypothetical protein